MPCSPAVPGPAVLEMSGLWPICYWGSGTRYDRKSTSFPPVWTPIEIRLTINLQKGCSKVNKNDHHAPQSHNLGCPRPRKTIKNQRNSMVSAIFPKCHPGGILGAFYIPRAPTASPRERIIHPKCHQSDPGSLQFPSMCPKSIPGVFKMTPELQKESPKLPNHVPKTPKPHSPVPVQGPAAGGVALKIKKK